MEKRQGRQLPTKSVVLDYETTHGDEAIALYNQCGNTALEWQERLCQNMMAYDAEGLWVHQKFGYAVPRRNGKTEDVLMRCIWGLEHGERILYTAHRSTTAHAVWTRLEQMCAKIGIEIASSFKAFGKEHLYTVDGGIIEFRTRTSSGALGEGYDLLVIDEAQEYTEAQETALKYIVTDSRNPQTVFLGTPPTAVSAGTVFQKYRDTVLTGKGYESAWEEWSVDELVEDVYNVDNWYETNPSLGSVLTERTIRAEITDDNVDFNIQRLGLWLKYNQKSAISKAEWKRLEIPTTPKLKGKLFVGIKYGRDDVNVAMSVAVRTETGEIFVESIDCRSVREGNAWIIKFLEQSDIAKTIVDGANGSQLLIKAARDNHVRPLPFVPKVPEIIQANAAFEQAVVSGGLVHRDQPAVEQIVSNCDKRTIGSNGGFGYKSIRDDCEVAILDSLLLAYWLCASHKEKKQRISY